MLILRVIPKKKWLYIGENNAMHIACGDMNSRTEELAAMVQSMITLTGSERRRVRRALLLRFCSPLVVSKFRPT
jgi:hypothetical protein